MSTTLFIDFESFQHGDEDFQLKELCILDSSAPLKPISYVFKPSKKWEALNKQQQRTYAYLEHHLHHLSWCEGVKRYCSSCVERHIKAAVPSYETARFYVLGKQKADFLRRELPMFDIVEYSFAESYKDIPRAPPHVCCTYRNHSKEHCAVLKCYRLYSHFMTF